MYIRIYTYICASLYILYMHIMCACNMGICMNGWIYTRMHVCMCVYIYIFNEINILLYYNFSFPSHKLF